MNVASLELCKELYELSDWDGTEKCYMRGELRQTPRHMFEGFNCYAYDLGYLMRKLPASILEADSEQYIWMFIEKDDDGYGGGYQDINGQTHKLYYAADTPEDAACLLAIELFKQGVLTK